MKDTSSANVVDWEELDRRVRPVFMDHVALIRHSLSYPCVREAYAHTIPEAIAYAEAMLSCDPKHRYDQWLPEVVAAYRALGAAGVTGYADLVDRISTREGVEALLAQTRIPLPQFAGLVHLLRYWVIPPDHLLRELVAPDDAAGKAHVAVLKSAGIAGSLDLLQRGHAAEGRRRIAMETGIPESFIIGLVHRADLRRLPYHSRKTISHLMGAGAGSLAALAAMDPDAFVGAVLDYGRSIGKDLRFGVEPASSALIARVLPPMVEGD